MSIAGFNFEENEEEIREEINEGIDMYEEEKIEPKYDIKLTVEEVNNMKPGVIISKLGLKITGELVEEVAIDLIKNISNQVYIVDSLPEGMLNDLREEDTANKIEDATEVIETPESEITEEAVEETIEQSDTVDLNQGTVNMNLDSMFSDDDIIDEDTVSEDEILEITEDRDGYINPVTGEVELFDNMTEALVEEVEEEVALPIDEDRTTDTPIDSEIDQTATQVLNESREVKEAPVRDSSYIKETNYPVEDTFLNKEDHKFSSSLDAINNIIREIDVDKVVTKLDIDSKGNYLVLELYVDELLLLELILSSHGEVMVTSDNIASIKGAISPRIVNFDTRFRNAINCKWNHNYDTYVIKAENESGVLVDQTIVVSKDNEDMQEYFYKPIAATIEASVPHTLDNVHIASQSLTQAEYDNLEDKVVVINHLDPITKEIEPFTYAIKKIVTPIQGMNARNVQLVFQRLQLIGETYYVAGVYYSQAFIETVKEVTI